MSGPSHTRTGGGAPLVLLHGIGSRAGVWDPVVERLAAEFEVIAVDLPGFAGTPLGDVDPSVEGLTDAVAGFLESAGLHRPRIAGSSLGGAIALELGRRGMAGSVVAFAPIGFWRGPGAAWCRGVVTAVHRAAPRTARIMPMLARFRLTRAAGLGIFYGRPERVPAAVVLQDFAAFGGSAVLPEVAAEMTGYRFDPRGYPGIPVTVAWGTRDLLLPARTQARRARLRLRQATHVALDGCGHIPFNDDPESCRQVLLGRYTRVFGSSAAPMDTESVAEPTQPVAEKAE